MREDIIVYLGYLKRELPRFFQFLLGFSESEVIGDRIIFNFYRQYHFYLNLDLVTKEIKVLDYSKQDPTFCPVANDLIVDILFNQVDVIVKSFDFQTDEKVPTLDYVVSCVSTCESLNELVVSFDFGDLLVHFKQGKLVGRRLYWFTKGFGRQTICIDLSTQKFVVVPKITDQDISQYQQVDFIAYLQVLEEIGDFLFFLRENYLLYLICLGIKNDPKLMKLVGDGGFLIDNVFYWLTSPERYLRIDLVKLTAHFVTGIVKDPKFGIELTQAQMAQAINFIKYVMSERSGTDDLLADLGGSQGKGIPRTFVKNFSLS